MKKPIAVDAHFVWGAINLHNAIVASKRKRKGKTLEHNPAIVVANDIHAEEMGEDHTNTERADDALAAVRAFQKACSTDDEDAVADLICNLGHLCDMWPEIFGTFEGQLARGKANYDQEKPR